MLAQKCNAGRTVQQHLQICSCGERGVCVYGFGLWVWVTTTEIMKTTTNRNPHLCIVHSLLYYPTTQHWLWLCCALPLSLPVALSLSLFVCSLHLVAPALFCTHWAAPLSLTFFGCSFSLIFVSRRIHKNSLKAAHDAASTLSLTSTAL